MILHVSTMTIRWCAAK